MGGAGEELHSSELGRRISTIMGNARETDFLRQHLPLHRSQSKEEMPYPFEAPLASTPRTRQSALNCLETAHYLSSHAVLVPHCILQWVDSKPLVLIPF